MEFFILSYCCYLLRQHSFRICIRILRESVPRKVDKKSGVPQEEKRVWGSQGEKGKFFLLYVLVNVTMYLAQRHISPKQEPSD